MIRNSSTPDSYEEHYGTGPTLATRPPRGHYGDDRRRQTIIERLLAYSFRPITTTWQYQAALSRNQSFMINYQASAGPEDTFWPVLEATQDHKR